MSKQNNKLTKERIRARARVTKDRTKATLRRGKQSIFSRIAKIIFHRVFFVSLGILLQLLIMAVPIIWFARYVALFYFVYIIIAIIAVLKIISSRYQSAYKISWVVLVLAVPMFGGLMYLFYGGNKIGKRARRKMNRQEESVRTFMGHSDPAVRAELEEQGSVAATQARYLEDASFCPPHLHTETTYFPLGDDMFVAIKRELERAERFIFLEYFIIRPGIMWDEILEILRRKVAQGVDVRVMYDDVGCLYTLPANYDRTLQQMGIACQVFNRYRPVVTLRLNNRDHRKILIIDGNVGFTGGINLADEYINQLERFGHWKDTGVMLRGEAVWNFTVMFLSAWDYSRDIVEDFDKFRPTLPPESVPNDGVVQPYDDSPLDDRPVGAIVYHNLISKAAQYVYITTPYLVVDDDMTSALCVAAQSGVDVRIITPHIPDKKIVFELTRAHYQILLESGVRIFEYTPGFIHAKNFVVDDRFATVGTINLDYRSLYLHFECGVWMSESSAVQDVRRDFLETQAKCQEVSLEDAKEFSRHKRLYHAMLRAFASLF